MTPHRRSATTTGALFVVATLAALAADRVVPSLTGTDPLAEVAQHPTRLSVAALLYLVAAGTSAGIAISLHPVLRAASVAGSLTAVAFRTVEAVFYTVAVVALVSLAPLGDGAADERPAARTVADALLAVRENATVVGVVAFTVGALFYYALMYRSGLVPRWLSGWGLAAAVTMLAACVLALFEGRPVTGYAPFIVPILVQELVLAGRLLLRGFDVRAVPDGTGPLAPSTSGSRS